MTFARHRGRVHRGPYREEMYLAGLTAAGALLALLLLGWAAAGAGL